MVLRKLCCGQFFKGSITQEAMNLSPFKVGDRARLEEGDCFGTTCEVKVVAVYKHGNVLVKAGSNLIDTTTRYLTLLPEIDGPLEPERMEVNGAAVAYIHRLEIECRVMAALIIDNPTATEVAKRTAQNAKEMISIRGDLTVL
jgi:hypothetical protein